MPASDIATQLLGSREQGLLRSALGSVLGLGYRLAGAHRQRVRLEQVQDTPLLVLPTVFNPRLLRTGVPDAETAAAIRRVGPKPVSDGAATDASGRHFFTNVNEGGIDRLGTDGKLVPLVRDARLDWPDSVHVGDSSWLYISVNQLYKTPAFTGGRDEGKPPYRIMRVWSGDATR